VVGARHRTIISRVVEVELVLDARVFITATRPEAKPVPCPDVAVCVELRPSPSITSKPWGHAAFAC
jgi:hypothetical protein